MKLCDCCGCRGPEHGGFGAVLRRVECGCVQDNANSMAADQSVCAFKQSLRPRAVVCLVGNLVVNWLRVV